MKKIAEVSFAVACIISLLVGMLHFFAPYAFGWYSYIPDAPTEIIQSVNYVNFCFYLFLLRPCMAVTNRHTADLAMAFRASGLAGFSIHHPVHLHISSDYLFTNSWQTRVGQHIG